MSTAPQSVWDYKTPRVMLVPYCPKKRDLFPEDLLVGLYWQTKKDELLYPVFPGVRDLDLNWFISYLTTKSVILFYALDGERLTEICGYAWLAEVEGVDGGRKASVSYVFFKKFWGTRLPRESAWLAQSWWFTEMNVDILYGTILKDNVLAQNFSRKFGFRQLTVLPRFFCRNSQLIDATLNCVEREEFMERFARWRDSMTAEAHHG